MVTFDYCFKLSQAIEAIQFEYFGWFRNFYIDVGGRFNSKRVSVWRQAEKKVGHLSSVPVANLMM